MGMTAIRVHYASVYQALDAAVAASACLASSEARIHRALTDLRSDRADPEAVAQLEQAALELRRLSIASISNRQDERLAAIERLRAAAERWMDRLPIQ